MDGFRGHLLEKGVSVKSANQTQVLSHPGRSALVGVIEGRLIHFDLR